VSAWWREGEHGANSRRGTLAIVGDHSMIDSVASPQLVAPGTFPALSDPRVRDRVDDVRVDIVRLASLTPTRSPPARRR
jgi:hypothetical protein